LPDVNHALNKRDLRILRLVDFCDPSQVSQSLDVNQSTVRQIVYKWRNISTVATLPRSGRPAKMIARAQGRMLKEDK
jgi:transposase